MEKNLSELKDLVKKCKDNHELTDESLNSINGGYTPSGPDPLALLFALLEGLPTLIEQNRGCLKQIMSALGKFNSEEKQKFEDWVKSKLALIDADDEEIKKIFKEHGIEFKF